ncbi:MAG: hypothetical protein QME41_07210 [Actinomycetota bacterium]|nr:hypothetical protein [Actinomycetota bacterium]
MEEAAELGMYLPFCFQSESEQVYIAFPWDAFETNYTHSKRKFAFVAQHMHTTSFVYFNIRIDFLSLLP